MARRGAKVLKPCTRRKDSGVAYVSPAGASAAGAAAPRTAGAKDPTPSKTAGNNATEPAGERRIREETTATADVALGETPPESYAFPHDNPVPTTAARALTVGVAAVSAGKESMPAVRIAEATALADKEVYSAPIDATERAERLTGTGKDASATAERAKLLACEESTRQRGAEGASGKTGENEASVSARATALRTTGFVRDLGTAPGVTAATPTEAGTKGLKTTVKRPEKARVSPNATVTAPRLAAETSSGRKNLEQRCFEGRAGQTDGGGRAEFPGAAATAAVATSPFCDAFTNATTAAPNLSAAGGRPATAAVAQRTSKSSVEVAVTLGARANSHGEAGSFLTDDTPGAAAPPSTADVRGSYINTHPATTAKQSSERPDKCNQSEAAGETGVDRAVTAAVTTAAGTAAQTKLTQDVALSAVTKVQVMRLHQAACRATGMQVAPATFPGSGGRTGTAGRQSQVGAVAPAAATAQVPERFTGEVATDLLQAPAAQGVQEAAVAIRGNENAAIAREKGATAPAVCGPGGKTEAASVAVLTSSSHVAELRTTHSKSSNLEVLCVRGARSKQDSLQSREPTEHTETTKTGSGWNTYNPAEEINTEKEKSSTEDQAEENKDNSGGTSAAVAGNSTGKSVATSSSTCNRSRESSGSSRSTRMGKRRSCKRRGSSHSVSRSISGSTSAAYSWPGTQAPNVRRQSIRRCRINIEQRGRRKRATEGMTGRRQSRKEEERLLRHQLADADAEYAGNSPQLQPREEKDLELNRGQQHVPLQLLQKQDKHQEKPLQNMQELPNGGDHRRHGLHQPKQKEKDVMGQPHERDDEQKKEQQQQTRGSRNVISFQPENPGQDSGEFGSSFGENLRRSAASTRLVAAETAEGRAVAAPADTPDGPGAPTPAAATGGSLLILTETDSATRKSTADRAPASPAAAVAPATSPRGAAAKDDATAVAAAKGATAVGTRAARAEGEALLAQVSAIGENTQEMAVLSEDAAAPRKVGPPAAAVAEDTTSATPLIKVSLWRAVDQAAIKAPSHVQGRSGELAETGNSVSSPQRHWEQLIAALEKEQTREGVAVTLAPESPATDEAVSDRTKAGSAAVAEEEAVAPVVAKIHVRTNDSVVTPAGESHRTDSQQERGKKATDENAALVSSGNHQDEIDQEVRDQRQCNSLQLQNEQTWEHQARQLQVEQLQDDDQHVGERRTQGMEWTGKQRTAKGQQRCMPEQRQMRGHFYIQRKGRQPGEHQISSQEGKTEKVLQPGCDAQPQETQQPPEQEQEQEHGERQEYEKVSDISCQRCKKRFADVISALPQLLCLLQQQALQQKAGEQERHCDERHQKPSTQQQSEDDGQQPCSQWEEQRLNCSQAHQAKRQQNGNQEAHVGQQEARWFTPGWTEQSPSGTLQHHEQNCSQNYHQGEEEEEEKQQQQQPDMPSEWWIDAEEKEKEQKRRGSTKLGDGLSFDYLRAAVKEKVLELRRQQQQSRINFHPLVEDATALSKYLDHIRTQQAVMQRQISLLQKQLLHMDQQQATLEQQRCQLRTVQESIKWRQEQLLRPASLDVFHQHPLPQRRTDTAREYHQLQGRQAELGQQQHQMVEEQTLVQQQGYPEGSQLLRGLLQHEHEEGEDKSLLAQRQRGRATLQQDTGGGPPLEQPQQLNEELEEKPSPPILDEQQRQLLLQLMQELSHRLTQPLQQYQQQCESTSPAQLLPKEEHQLGSENLPPQRQQQSDSQLQESQQHRQSQKGYGHLLEGQENEDLSQAGMLPQHQRQHGDYTGSVSASLERILIKLTSSESYLNPEAPAESCFLPMPPTQISGSFSTCHTLDGLTAYRRIDAASLVSSPVAAAPLPDASSSVSLVAVSPAAAGAAVSHHSPHSSYMCSNDASKKQRQQRQPGERMRKDLERAKREPHLSPGQHARDINEQKQHSDSESKCHPASVLQTADIANPALSGPGAAVSSPQHGELRTSICSRAFPSAYTRAIAPATFLHASTVGTTRTAAGGVEPPQAASLSIAARTSAPALPTCICASAEVPRCTTATSTEAARIFLPAIQDAAPDASLPDAAATSPAAAEARAQVEAVEAKDRCPQRETHEEAEEGEQNGERYRQSGRSRAVAERDAFYYLLKNVSTGDRADEEGTAAAACDGAAAKPSETANATAAVAVLLEAWDWLGVSVEREQDRTTAKLAAARRAKDANADGQGRRQQGEWRHPRERQLLQEMQRQRQQEQQDQEQTQCLFGDEVAASKKRFCCASKIATGVETVNRDARAARVTKAAIRAAEAPSAGQSATERPASYVGREHQGELVERTRLCGNTAADISLATQQAAEIGGKTAMNRGGAGHLTSSEIVVPVARMKESENTAAVGSAANNTFSWHPGQHSCYPFAASGLQQLQASEWEQSGQQFTDEKHLQQRRSSMEQHERQLDGEGNQPLRVSMRYLTLAGGEPTHLAPVGNQNISFDTDHPSHSSRSAGTAAASLSAALVSPQPAGFSVRSPSATGIAVEYPPAFILSGAAASPPLHGSPAVAGNRDQPLNLLSPKPVSTVATAPANAHEVISPVARAVAAPALRPVALEITPPAAAAVILSAAARRVNSKAEEDDVQTSSIRCGRVERIVSVSEEEKQERECDDPEKSSTWSSPLADQQRLPLQVQSLLPSLSVADQQNYDTSYLHAGTLTVAATAEVAPEAAATTQPVPRTALTSTHAIGPAAALTLPRAATASVRPLASAERLSPADAVQSPPTAAVFPSSIDAAALPAKATLPLAGEHVQVAAALSTEATALLPVTATVSQEVAEAPRTGPSTVLGSACFLGNPYYAEVSDFTWNAEEPAQLQPKEEMLQVPHQRGRQQWQQEEEVSQWKEGVEGAAQWQQHIQGETQQLALPQAEKQQQPLKRVSSSSAHQFLSCRDSTTPLGLGASFAAFRFAAQCNEGEIYLGQPDDGLQQQLALQLPSLPASAGAAAFEEANVSISAGGSSPQAAHSRRSELTPTTAAGRSRSAAPYFTSATPVACLDVPSSFAYARATGSAADPTSVIAAAAGDNGENRFAAIPIRAPELAGCSTAGSAVAAASCHEAGQHRSPHIGATPAGASPNEGLPICTPPPPPPPLPQPYNTSLVSQLTHLSASTHNEWRSPRLLAPSENSKKTLAKKITASDLHTGPSVFTAAADTHTEYFCASATAVVHQVAAEPKMNLQRQRAMQQEEHSTLQQQHLAAQQQRATQQQQTEVLPQLGQIRLQQQEGGERSFALESGTPAEGRLSDFVSFPPSPLQVSQQYQQWHSELQLFSTGEQEQQQPFAAGCEERELRKLPETRQPLQQGANANQQLLHQRLGRQEGDQKREGSRNSREEEKQRARDCFPTASESRVFAGPPGDLLVQPMHHSEPFHVPQHLVMQQREQQLLTENTTTEEVFTDVRQLPSATAAGGVCVSESDAGAASFRTIAEGADGIAALARRTTLAVSARSPQTAAYSYDMWDDSGQQPVKQWNGSSTSRYRTSSSNAIAVCVGRVEEEARTRSPMGTQTAKSERRLSTAATRHQKASAVAPNVAAAPDGPSQPGGTHPSRPYAVENRFSTVSGLSKAAVTKVAYPATAGGAPAAGVASGRAPPERRGGDGNSLHNLSEYADVMRHREASSSRHSGRGPAAAAEAAAATVRNFRRSAYTQQQRVTRTRGKRFLGGGSSCRRYVAGQPRHVAAEWRDDLTTRAPPPPPPPLQEGGDDGTAATGGKVEATGFANLGYPAAAGPGSFQAAGGATPSLEKFSTPANFNEGAVLPVLQPRKAAAPVELNWSGRRSSSACPTVEKRNLLRLQQHSGDAAEGGRYLHPYASSATSCRGGRQFLSQQPQQHQQRQYLNVGFVGCRDYWTSEGKRQSSNHIETSTAASEYSSSRGSKRGCATTKEGLAAPGFLSPSAVTAAAKRAPTPVVPHSEAPVIATATLPASAARSSPAVVEAIAKARAGEIVAERRKQNSPPAAARQLVTAAARTGRNAPPAATGDITLSDSGLAGRRGRLSAAATIATGEAPITGSVCSAATGVEERGRKKAVKHPAATDVEPPAGEGVAGSNAVETRGEDEVTATARGGCAGVAEVAAGGAGSVRTGGARRAAATEAAAQTASDAKAAAGAAETKEECRGDTEQSSEEKGLTTVMLRNIPNKYSRQQVMEEIDVHFKGTYNFFYLPIDFVHGCNVGYCFINFLDVKTAEAFRQEFEGKRLSLFKSRKICSVTYGRVQGLKAILEHYFHSAVVQAQYPSWRPVVLKDCVELPWSELHNIFPELFDSKFPASSTGRQSSSLSAVGTSEKGHRSSSSSSSASSSASSSSLAKVTDAGTLPTNSIDEDGGGHAATGAKGMKGASGVGAASSPAGTVATGTEEFTQQRGSNCSSSGAVRTRATARGSGMVGRGARGSENRDVILAAAGTTGDSFQEEYFTVNGADCDTPNQKPAGRQWPLLGQEPAQDGKISVHGEEGDFEAGVGETRLHDAGGERTTTSSSLAGGEGIQCTLAPPVPDARPRPAGRSERPEGAAGKGGESEEATLPACGGLLAPRRLSVGRRRGRKLGVTIEARRRELRNLASKHMCTPNRFAAYRESFTAAAVSAARHRAPRACSPGTRLRSYNNTSSSGAAVAAAGSKKQAAAAAGPETGSFLAPASGDYDRTALRSLNVARCRGFIHGGRGLGVTDTAAAANSVSAGGAAPAAGGEGGGAELVALSQATAAVGNGGTSAAAGVASGVRCHQERLLCARQLQKRRQEEQ